MIETQNFYPQSGLGLRIGIFTPPRYNGDDQPATSARLYQPYGLFVHNDQVYITDYYNNRVRKILPNGIIKTIAGTGKYGQYNGDGTLATGSHCYHPTGIFVDDSGIYICCSDARIRKIDCNGIFSTIVRWCSIWISQISTYWTTKETIDQTISKILPWYYHPFPQSAQWRVLWTIEQKGQANNKN